MFLIFETKVYLWIENSVPFMHVCIDMGACMFKGAYVCVCTHVEVIGQPWVLSSETVSLAQSFPSRAGWLTSELSPS